LALKWGSGKQINIFYKLSFGKYWHKCLIVLVLTTLMLSKCPGYFTLYPLIFYDTKFTSLSLIYIPNINLFGNKGPRPNSKPP